MDNVIDKEALMNSLFLGQGMPSKNSNHPSGEVVTLLPPNQLVDFHSNELGHQPYQVRDDEDMEKLVESAHERGIISPLIVRVDSKIPEKYEILSGHRRKTAALRAGLTEVPVLVKEADDDEANIIVCDANMYREDVAPSEKAWAYRCKLEAMHNLGIRKQGMRTDLTSDPVGPKLKGKTSTAIIADESEDSMTQIKRYIRLTYLLPELLQMVDDGQLKFRVGVELSYLERPEQEALLDVIICDRVKPSLEQAQQLKQMSKEKRDLTVDLIHVLLQKEPGNSGLTAGYINKLLPQPIRKMPASRKKEYAAKALEHYAKYLAEHPEEGQQWLADSRN
ncbi:ParB/RepB/Spo0J family partition protein [Ihubacter sp. mB4P-1]|uniref:ParB/RepB/Spo0J family partition protein n=1 Tax=Ihubacter sp. mB4P-1 TaxID=3242370 RepID=UPI003C7DC80F